MLLSRKCKKGGAVEFSTGFADLTQMMPDASFQRDVALEQLIDRTYTTWDDLKQVRALFLHQPGSGIGKPERDADKWKQLEDNVTLINADTKVTVFLEITSRLKDISGENTDATQKLGSVFDEVKNFLTATSSQERTRLLRMFLISGNNGLFSEVNFQTHGRIVVNNILDGIFSQQDKIAGGKGLESGWSAAEKDTIKQVATCILDKLPPERRTQVFCEFINGLLDCKEAPDKNELVKLGLDIFGVVGAKIGQLDALLPKELRNTLSYMKDHIPPCSKLAIAEALIKEGRDKVYEGLGKFIGGGSTAVAILARENKTASGQYGQKVVKMIRPEAAMHVDNDLESVKPGVEIAIKAMNLDVEVEEVFEELRGMVREEMDLTYERANNVFIGEFRDRHGSNVHTPQITYLSSNSDFMEMDVAPGKSLSDIEVLQERALKGQPLSETEQRYAKLDLKGVEKKVVQDFLDQVFVLGIFHTDLHQGNIFVDASSTDHNGTRVTEIDYAQTGLVDSPEQKDALLEYCIGLHIKDPSLIINAFCAFMPQISRKEITDKFNAMDGSMVDKASSLLAKLKAHGSIVRFTKALVNVLPYIEKIPSPSRLMTPYVTSRRVIRDLYEAKWKVSHAVLDEILNQKQVTGIV